MATYVAMLRGINVGGKNKIKMSDLQELFAGLGYSDVVTYIQSGNVVFKSPSKSAPPLQSAIEKRIAAEFGMDIATVIRTKTDLAKVLAANPFGGVDLAKVHVTFLQDKPAAALVRALDGHTSPPDEFRVIGREVYVHCPEGYGNTKLNNTFWERKLKTPSTARNWNTVTKLLDLSTT